MTDSESNLKGRYRFHGIQLIFQKLVTKWANMSGSTLKWDNEQIEQLSKHIHQVSIHISKATSSTCAVIKIKKNLKPLNHKHYNFNWIFFAPFSHKEWCHLTSYLLEIPWIFSSKHASQAMHQAHQTCSWIKGNQKMVFSK